MTTCKDQKKMKTIISIMLLAVLAFAANDTKAQATTLKWSGYSNTLDTVTNTGTRFASVAVPGTATAFSFVLRVTKISGTVGGTISWQGSNNGTDYVTISTTTPSDASANYSYSIATPLPYLYYRASWTGTGTMSASVSGVAYLRKN